MEDEIEMRGIGEEHTVQVIKDLMMAYERRIRSDCTQEQLEQQPWRVAEYIAGESLLRMLESPDPKPERYDVTNGLRDEIEDQYQSLCLKARLGGAAIVDELADLAGRMSQMMQVIDELTSAVFCACPSPMVTHQPLCDFCGKQVKGESK